MPVYQDKERGTYYVKTYYEDWTGKRCQKLKRGFKLQREAKAWERDFLERYQRNAGISFKTLCELYLEDVETRCKRSTYVTSKSMCERHLLPYWKNRKISEITPADIRQWQNLVISGGSSECYQYNLHKQLSAVFNFGVRYHGLSANPCSATTSIGKSNVHRLDFWTADEFNAFLPTVKALPTRTALQVLFYTGMRCGELLALTLEDFNATERTIRINKTYHRYDKADCLTSPKTENSNRTVTLPAFLADLLTEYISHLYEPAPDDRIFALVTPRKLKTAIQSGSRKIGIKAIKIHDLRHSHVSLLIDMGFSTFLISERIGDTPAMVNRVYGHLYPNKHREVAEQLNNLVSK